MHIQLLSSLRQAPLRRTRQLAKNRSSAYLSVRFPIPVYAVDGVIPVHPSRESPGVGPHAHTHDRTLDIRAALESEMPFVAASKA
eukprot:2817276-Prorocentrum_lima.AAC.1